MNKILINDDYGCFQGSWPRAAIQAMLDRYPEVFTRVIDYNDPEHLKGTNYELMDHIVVLFSESVSRHDPRLIEIAEEFNFNDDKSHNLKIVEIKGDTYYIREYDGMEWVVEPDDIEWTQVAEGTRSSSKEKIT